MENPFKKLFSGSAEREQADKAKQLEELREWRKQVEMGMQMETTRGDAEQLERIDAQIAELEGK